MIKSLEQQIQEDYNFSQITLTKTPEHQGCVNDVYHMTSPMHEGYVRITIRSDRSLNDLLEEMNFVQYLSSQGVSVATPYTSMDGHTICRLNFNNRAYNYSIFQPAKGEQLCQRNYRYIEGVPVKQHHFNCGQILGQLHKASETYIPAAERIHILDHLQELIQTYLPDHKHLVRERFKDLIIRFEGLERNPLNYGMIHGDFGDGNYNIDYENGAITLFDFDDAGYCWFMYEVASAWVAATGWVMYESNLEKRRILMDDIFASIIEGYRSARDLDDSNIHDLELYLKLVEMEWFLGALVCQSKTNGCIDFEDEYLLELTYNIENNIPYFGLFEDD